jgi:DHA2 family multidrug resistance protein
VAVVAAAPPGAVGADQAPVVEPNITMLTVTVMTGLVMAIIDASIVNVALNDMAGNLGASINEIAWVATGYILANVIVMPLNGWLTATFGRRNFYATSIAIFTIASFFCGTSRSLVEIVIWRVIQGIGGGALQPTAQSILFESYPPSKRPQAMAIFGLGAMVGPAIGPTLGGFIVQNYSWPLIFFINLPIGIAAFFMTLRYVHNPAHIKRSTRGMDWLGLAAMTVGIGGLQYVLQRGQQEDWFSSSTIVIWTILSVAGLAFFIIRELRDSHPFVDLRVFRWRSFSAGNVIGIVAGFGLFGLNLILPLFFQNVLNMGPWDAGLALLPGAVATMFSMLVAPRLLTIIGSRASIIAGMLIFALGAWWMGGLDQTAGYWNIFWPRAMQGFALGFIFVPLTTVTLAQIPNSEMAGATGIFTLLRQLGGGIGIAALELLIQLRQDYDQQLLAANVSLHNPNVAQYLNAAANKAQALAYLGQQVALNATVLAYDYAFRVCALVFVVAIPMVLLLRKPKAGSGAAPVHLE